MSEKKKFVCGNCNWVLKEDQISLHSCLNIDKNKQILIATDDRRVFVQDIENCYFDKENDAQENNTERMENEVEEEIDVPHSINKQILDEELINAVQKRPPLYDYRMPLKERSRQKTDLWKKVSEDLNGIYTSTEAEKRWNYLKDRYRKSFNSYKKVQESTQRSGAAGIHKNQLIKPSFKHHHLMSFFNDIFEHRLSISSIRMSREPQPSISREPQPSISREPQLSTSNREPQPSISREPQLSTSNREPQPSTSNREPQPSTSSLVENENSLDEVISEENNENEFSVSSVSNFSYRNTPTPLEKKRKRNSGNYDECDQILLDILKKPSEPNPIDCFMVRLAEGMRRLPYKVRSKLELEFLTRLNEVEEQLELDN
ncbi:unnamed protein product [Lasius platythorax]|uniref:MADF domain-containing protein n=1 Tax=Lasius platythorax TaxID=488582 RepID=A0AAV2NND8_9HYME